MITKGPYIVNPSISIRKNPLKSIAFSVDFYSIPGENVWVLGSIPEFGNWGLNGALSLGWNRGGIWKGERKIERDIKIPDIISTGIEMNSEISPQLLVNIFVPNTPLHDGAVIISNNQIQAAACLLPLADDKDLARELGTRHRAAIGISKDSDAIAIVVSEETGKISIAKNGTLISNVSEDALKRILLKSLIYDRFGDENSKDFKDNFKNKITERKHIRKKKSDKILKTEETIKEEKKSE